VPKPCELNLKAAGLPIVEGLADPTVRRLLADQGALRIVQIPAHRGQSFRRIADSVPVIADSF
jgi:hypothetical protein